MLVTKKTMRSLMVMLSCSLAACSSYYEDEVLAPTDQEIETFTEIKPQSVLKDGVFHMQKVQNGSTVLVPNRIKLQRPNLPPFDVAYISRDIESVLLELANAAGESIVIPEGLRGHSITLVHSGADFQQMLELVLEKAGYHYNYVNGVWRVTRYPIRNYMLELSQSSRSGSLVASEELGAESDGSSATTSSAAKLDTAYEDAVWDQVEETLKELVEVGKSDVKDAAKATASGGISAGGKVLKSGEKLLAPPRVDDSAEEASVDDFFGTITEGGGFRPYETTAPGSTDHLLPEEGAEPWYKLTRSAGLITIRASASAHRLIEDYLEQVQQSQLRQIFVEARVVAVVKNKATDRGIGGSFADGVGSSLTGNLGFSAVNPLTDVTAQGFFYTLSNSSKDINVVMQSLSDIGDVYTISSPSLLARNNQLSRVSITKQLGYVETSVETNTTSDGNVNIGSRTDTAKFKNSGTVLSVFPFIGKNKVQMRMRMAVAQKSGDTEISTRVGDNEAITNKVPELTNNIIDQDMVLEYGRVYAIGGLIESSTSVDNTYVPGLNQIPGFKDILQRAQASKADTEFVVLIRISRS